MKKVLFTLAGMTFLGLVACGPSAEQKKAMEEQAQRSADSAANALLQQASTSASDSVMAAPVDSTQK